ncbi:hypothetical protein BpHYR1_026042 [Brachionus plicatilis]|uniref:Uncharacterized protein n=1 Tax=Brachionus plicatilis TaxID=10195 RepID=A0A3M7SZY5_BRAPC|nr:hypothetical protein BpHYR1_026042 [Brachionus plicatilis]
MFSIEPFNSISEMLSLSGIQRTESTKRNRAKLKSTNRVIKKWNSLSNIGIGASTVNQFKNRQMEASRWTWEPLCNEAILPQRPPEQQRRLQSKCPRQPTSTYFIWPLFV